MLTLKTYIDERFDQNASRLLKNTKVLPRYNELHDRLSKLDIKNYIDEKLIQVKNILTFLTP
ncbi:hypothetical protein [Vallitalea sp.]|jgi:hypothetical protein|uniref:hypothetical protein n=1 Tax=Vallitalea sp. TaxID=1882829 RepID=UPI0025CF54F0|nr:hypothetical protein [Vallitalea sp.]MCT4686621.1 hypothetical protein [Vallitalea sp.]